MKDFINNYIKNAIKYEKLNECYHKNEPLEDHDINEIHLQELYDLNDQLFDEILKLKKELENAINNSIRNENR